MGSKAPTTGKLYFKLSYCGKSKFVMRNQTIGVDHVSTPPKTFRHVTLYPGVRLHSVTMRCELEDPYTFEVESSKFSISFCTTGYSSITFASKSICPREVIHCPSSCTLAYLDAAKGTWRPASESCRVATLVIDPSVFTRVWQEFGDALPHELRPLVKERMPDPFFVGLPSNASFQMIINSLLHNSFNGPGQRLLLECKVLELLVHLVTLLAKRKQLENSPIALTVNDVERIHEARTLLEQNMENPPSLSELSRMAGLNEFKLKRGFRQIFGTTPFGHLRTARLEQAKKYLETGDMNVYEACVAVGYSSLSNFIALFKKEFGTTPGKVLQCALRAGNRNLSNALGTL